jgi:hypothetical protein
MLVVIEHLTLLKSVVAWLDISPSPNWDCHWESLNPRSKTMLHCYVELREGSQLVPSSFHMVAGVSLLTQLFLPSPPIIYVP